MRTLPLGKRVVTFGETMGLATSSRFGSLLHDRSFDLSFGGAESNVAIGLSRLGIPVTWISKLGDDSLGRLILRELKAEDVHVVADIDADAPTGFMLKERRSEARTNVMFYRKGSAASSISPADIDADLIRNAALLHVTGIFPALSESTRLALFHGIALAGEARVPISFDLNYRSKLWSAENAAATYKILIPSCEVVFAGVEEAQLLFPTLSKPADLARALVDLGCGDAVIKQGSDGCTALIGGEELHKPAMKVHALDTVGAGDAFVAGYISELVTGGDADQRLSLSVITGALACLVPGDWEGAPRTDELLDLESSESVSR